ncbi:MAG: Eco57I restriction-modification methylase domain-containing protein [Candidatus Hermodarchaeota archaeon]
MVHGYPTYRLGAVSTPEQIVKYIVHVVLKSWEKYRGSPQTSKNLRILDPAVGDGRFLIHFALCFKELSERKDWNDNLQCYGLDVNPKSIKLAHRNFEEKEGLTFVDVHLKIGNALLGFIFKPKGREVTTLKNNIDDDFQFHYDLIKKDIQSVNYLFHWFQEWPEVLIHNGFDIILGNPPYGIQFSYEEKNLFRKLYQAFDPEMESYILFIERSIYLLREGGILVFIIPNNLLSNYHYQNIRQFLLDNTKILKIISLNRQIFPGFHVETCILILQRIADKSDRDKNKILFSTIDDPLNFPFKTTDNGSITQEESSKNPFKLLLPKPDVLIKRILKKIQHNNIALKNFVSISRGIELGFNSHLTSNKKLDSNFVPLIAGRSIRKFRLDKNIRYIRFDKDKKSIFKDYSIYQQPKILLRRIGHELTAVFDPHHHFCVCDVYMIILNPSRPILELKYLEVLLNSNLLSFYLRHNFTNVKQIFPKIPIGYLKKLPIKIPSSLSKIQELVENPIDLPWNIQKASSYQLKRIDRLNQEIFRIYDITSKEQEIILKKLPSLLGKKISSRNKIT